MRQVKKEEEYLPALEIASMLWQDNFKTIRKKRRAETDQLKGPESKINQKKKEKKKEQQNINN